MNRLDAAVRQIESLPPHKKPGYIDSLYARQIGNIMTDYTRSEEPFDEINCDEMRAFPGTNSSYSDKYDGPAICLAAAIKRMDSTGRFAPHVRKLRELPERARLANQLIAEIDEFTLEELIELTGPKGHPSDELLSRYNRSVQTGNISPYEFFMHGDGYCAWKDPGLTDYSEHRDAMRDDYDPMYRYTAWELSYRHVDGINNNNTIRQFYRMPDGQDWVCEVRTPTNDKGAISRPNIRIKPVNSEDSAWITIDPDSDTVPSYEGWVFEKWIRRTRMGKIRGGYSYGSGADTSLGYQGHTKKEHYVRDAQTLVE